MSNLTINETAKSQGVRLFDVFALGPFLVYAGYKSDNNLIKTGLLLAGVGTIWYNWQNFKTVNQAVDNDTKHEITK